MVSVFDTGPPAPCPDPFNMAAYVLAHADRLKQKPALIQPGGQSITYAELRKRVACVAGGLKAMGLRPGDRVLFRLGNTVEFPIAYLACIWGGFVPVPASAQLTVPEITEIARQTNPGLILAAGGVALPEPLPCPVVSQLPKGSPIAAVMGDPNRLAYIVYTSGTSGHPRGVCHAHRAIWARRMMHDGWYDISEGDRVMHAGAFNWTYTLGTGLMDPWSVGATAFIPDPETPPSELTKIAADEQVTILAAAPGVFRKILKSSIADMPALRHGLSAGEHLSENIRTNWRHATGTDLHQALGMSECSTFISSCPNAPAPRGSSGRPQHGRAVAVLGQDGPVPFGEPGTLAISTRDPGLMLGYLGDAPVAGDWFETGDMATLSHDGWITYLGRSDDMMNAGGFKVSPLEVEAAMAMLSGVTACAAIQLEIKRDASVIALFHVGCADEHALRAHAQETLARYKQPRLYISVDALPYGPNGKLNRRALRANYEAKHVRNDPA